MITDIRKFALSNGISGMTYDDYVSKTFKNAYVEPTVIEERNMASMTSIGVYSRLLMDRIIFLGTEINDDVANIMTAQLLWLEQQSDSDIQMMINSGGGSVYDGLQIIDTMNFIKPEVVTTVTGLSASMAAVIATCGSKGKRSALPHSSRSHLVNSTRWRPFAPMSKGPTMCSFQLLLTESRTWLSSQPTRPHILSTRWASPRQ